jgi:hypothetical protein
MNDASHHKRSGPQTAQPVNAFIAWLDLCSSQVEQWAEWQRRLWQPFLDLQAGCFGECLGRMGGPTVQRGCEQLA